MLNATALTARRSSHHPHLLMPPLNHLVDDEIDRGGGNNNLECLDHNKLRKTLPIAKIGRCRIPHLGGVASLIPRHKSM
ncbi:MAG: hypothetical protein WBF99_06470 [Xanthobacteraceae bacterium]